MNTLSILTCLGIVIVIARIMISHAQANRLLTRLSLACLGTPYLLKVTERLHGDLPTLVDVIRDLGLLGFLVVFVYGRIHQAAE